MPTFRARLLSTGLALGLTAGLAPAQRGGPPNPDESFNRLLASYGGTGDTLDYGRLPPDQRERLNRFAQFTNSPPVPASGIVTRDQFKAEFEQKMVALRSRFPQSGGPGGPPGGSDDADSERRFRDYDKNGDGQLTPDELSERYRASLPQYDANRDGALDLAEFKALRANRGRDIPSPAATPGAAPPAPSITYAPSPATPDRRRDEEPETPRPTVFRFGKLPKEVPSWFESLDTDADGQIGLYEWRADGRATAEFVAMDQNGDGYLTAEEWVRHTRLALEKPAAETPAASEATRVSERDRGDRSGRRERPSGGGSNPFLPRSR